MNAQEIVDFSILCWPVIILLVLAIGLYIFDNIQKNRQADIHRKRWEKNNPDLLAKEKE